MKLNWNLSNAHSKAHFHGQFQLRAAAPRKRPERHPFCIAFITCSKFPRMLSSSDAQSWWSRTGFCGTVITSCGIRNSLTMAVDLKRIRETCTEVDWIHTPWPLHDSMTTMNWTCPVAVGRQIRQMSGDVQRPGSDESATLHNGCGRLEDLLWFFLKVCLTLTILLY